MIIVSNLIVTIFISVCFIMIFMELLSFFVFYILYGNALNNNNESIFMKSKALANDTGTSFNHAINHGFVNLETDLLLIAKHVYPMSGTGGSSENENDEYLRYSSEYSNSEKFRNCLSETDRRNKDTSVEAYGNAFNYDDIDSQSAIIEMLGNKAFGTISPFFTDQSSKAGIEKYSCFTLSMIKSLFIRNIGIDKRKQLELNFTGYINNNVLTYPSYRTGTFDTIKTSDPFYDNNTQSCLESYDAKCMKFDKMLSNESNNRIAINNPIHLLNPSSNNYTYGLTRGCINGPFPEKDVSSLACINYNITAGLQEVRTEICEDVINFFGFSLDDERNDLDILYTSNSLYNLSVYNHTGFGQFLLESITDMKGFHYLFYDGFKPQIINETLSSIKEEVISNSIKQYGEISEKLIALIKNTSIVDTDKIMRFQMSLNRFSIKEVDDYGFIVTPIKPQFIAYNKTTYTFETDGESGKDEGDADVIFYSLAGVHIGTVSISQNILFLLIFKTIRSFFFYMFLTFFCTVIFYGITYMYLSSLLTPIKEMIILFNIQFKRKKKAGSKNETVSGGSGHHKTEVLVRENNKSFKKMFKKLIKNIETKEISETFSVLHKIVKLSRGDKTEAKTKAKLYSSFYANMNGKENDDLKKKCLLLIGFYNGKDKKYKEADYNFVSLINKLEEEEKIMLKKNNNLEENIYNLPLQIKHKHDQAQTPRYINENTKHMKYKKANKGYIKGKIIMQKTFYLLGLSKYYEFIRIKKKYKTAKKEIFILKNKENKYLLEQAISYLQKSLEINQIMKINQIKSIFTQILISKCYYNMDNHQTSAKYLKDALLQLSFLNTILYENEIDNNSSNENSCSEGDSNKKYTPDNRVMLITNSLITENIIYNITKVCIMKSKSKIATYLLRELIELNLFITDHILSKSCSRLYTLVKEAMQKTNHVDLLKMKKLKSNKSKIQFLEIMAKKANSQNRMKKAISIFFCQDSFKDKEEVSKGFMKQVVLKTFKQKYSPSDMFSYFELKNKCGSTCDFVSKDEFITDYSVRFKAKYSSLQDDINNAFEKIVSNITDGCKRDEYEKYIFYFIDDKNIDELTGKMRIDKRILMGNENQIQLYIFFVGDIGNKTRDSINYLLNKCQEVYFIVLSNLNVMKMILENISKIGRSNIGTTKLDNYLSVFMAE